MTSVLPVIVVVVVVVVLMSCCFVLFFFFCRKHNYDTELPAARLTLYSKNYFLGGGRPKKKLEGFVWGFLSITGLRSQGQFAPKCSFLASRPLGHCSFRISGQIS